MASKTYSITHSSPELSTVGDYINEKNSTGYMYSGKADKFLSVLGDDGLTNGQRILDNISRIPFEKDRLVKLGILSSEGKILVPNRLPIQTNTTFYLEWSEVNKESFITEGIEVVSTDDVAFKAEQLARLEANKGYVSVHRLQPSNFQSGTSKELFPNITVWVWCRALSPNRDMGSELQGQFIDVSPFITSVSTNMSKNGGNFNITLSPIVCELDEEGRWSIKKGDLIQYKDGYVAEGSLFSIDNQELRPNRFFFHEALSPNDLVFIRFETLEMEKEQRYSDSTKYFIDKSDIAGRIYDMIGLVDSKQTTIVPEKNDVSINISGRDLSKLFLEDGTYFYALENSQGLLKFAGQSTQKNTLLSRIFADGSSSFINLFMFTSIEYIFKFIIQQLANIRIVPDNLFTSYANSKKLVSGVEKTYDSRNKRFNEIADSNKVETDKSLNKTDYKKPYKEELASGIWQIVKLVIDKSVSQRRLADSSFATAQGALLNFIHSAAQEPLVEFYMDTYGDQYHLIARKPPYDQKALISLIEGRVNTEDGETSTPPAIIDIEADDVLIERLVMNDTQVYSWYHFFPRNALIGSAQNFSLAYLGAVYFEEYAQVFGSKPFQQSHPYIPYVPYENNDNGLLDIVESQAISDLKYVIECNQYLPFTRKGTLALNMDRRIKIGNIIRYKPTGEIFFVDGVQHKFQTGENGIDAITTITVHRGMVEQLIYGRHFKDDAGINNVVSYFNLIDTRLEKNVKTFQTPVTVRKKVGTKNVKREVFSLEPVLNTVPQFNTNPFAIEGVIQYPNLVKGQVYLEKYNSYPQSKNIFIKLINLINQRGYSVIILPLATNRTFWEQDALWRVNNNNARAGHGKHETGKAIDITVVDTKKGKYYSKETSEGEWLSTGVPQIANSLGLRWGGKSNDGRFGDYIDRVHFEISGGDTTTTVTEDVFEEVTEMKKTTGIDREGIFRNFKTNKFTFNFFLKNLQFDPDYRKVKSRTVYSSKQDGSFDVIVKGKKK